MVRRYRIVRIPEEAWNNLELKQRRMQDTINRIVRKPIKIPITKVLLAVSENEVNIGDDYLVRLTKSRRSKRK